MRPQRVTSIFDKKGIDSTNSPSESIINLNAEKEIEKRVASYILPERSDAQKKLLQKYLPSQCRYL